MIHKKIDISFQLGLARLLPFQTKSDAVDAVLRATTLGNLILLPWPERHAIPTLLGVFVRPNLRVG